MPSLPIINNLLNFVELQIPHPKETHQKEPHLRVVVRMILVTMQEPSRVGTRQANIPGSPTFGSTDRGGQPSCGLQIPTLSPEPAGVVRNLKTQPSLEPRPATVPLKTPESPPQGTGQCHCFPERDLV